MHAELVARTISLPGLLYCQSVTEILASQKGERYSDQMSSRNTFSVSCFYNETISTFEKDEAALNTELAKMLHSLQMYAHYLVMHMTLHMTHSIHDH